MIISMNLIFIRLISIGKWMENKASTHWSEGIQPVIFSINTRTSYITKKTPFQLVFSQDPRADCHQWRALHEASTKDSIEIDDLQIDSITRAPNSVKKIPSQSISSLSMLLPLKKTIETSKCKDIPVTNDVDESDFHSANISACARSQTCVRTDETDAKRITMNLGPLVRISEK